MGLLGFGFGFGFGFASSRSTLSVMLAAESR